MIKKCIIMTTIILFMLTSLTIISIADDPSPPPIPHGFHGYVIDENGDFYPENTDIKAVLNGKNYYTNVSENGTYGSLKGGEEFIILGDAQDLGSTIYFYINDTQAPQTAIFTQMGVNINFADYFNLSFDVLIISLVSTGSITKNQAVISWTTDKPSDSTVNYGTNTNLGNTVQDANYVTQHEITLTNLQSNTKYYFEVISNDQSGHTATDNNYGNLFSFKTQSDSGNGDTPPNGGGTPPVIPPPNAGELEENIPPVAKADGPYYTLLGNPINFDASNSTDSDGYIANYHWDFGDGNTQSSTDPSITYIYASIGEYTITLTVTDDYGDTDSITTIAYIHSDDTDGDGWTDEAEEYYGTNSSNPYDFPEDNDNDGVPDDWDSDDDNDGLTDLEEESIGTNSKDSSDVVKILNSYGLFYLIDTDNDGIVDKYYKKTTGITTELGDFGDNKFLIDINADGNYDFVYDASLGTIEEYKANTNLKSEENKSDIDNTPYIIVIVLFIVILSFIVFIKRRKK